MTTSNKPQPALCVDCDGTLIHSDLLYESILLKVKSSWISILRLPFWLFRGKASFKERLARSVSPDFSTLPYNQKIIALLQRARDEGRTTVLVTAAPQQYAEGVARHLNLFDQVFATSNKTNLAGQNKAARLIEAFGKGNFVYAGNSRADLPVWASSGGAIVVSSSARLKAAAAKATSVIETIPAHEFSFRTWLRAIRVHQWLKNLLVFVPALAAHQITDLRVAPSAFLAFFGFCFCSSAVYVINDLLDLTADRLHPRKRKRPFASGELSVANGVAVVPVLLALAITISALLPLQFAGVLLIYFATTCLYSFWLKGQVIVDVMLLASLYTTRIIAGAAATSIIPSFWLLAFSMFIFLSLALVKRYSEIMLWRMEGKQQILGRGYQIEDAPALLSLGSSAGFSAVMVLALYVNSVDVDYLYPNRQALWMTLPPLLYWISRVWLKSHRGEIHEDPVVFATRDKQSWLVAACIALAAWIAALHKSFIL
jgi:4-hydroxybenzoate polyprenyltransferase/phosphoserine phosphatase